MDNFNFPITAHEIIKNFGSVCNFFEIAIGEGYLPANRIELVRQYIKKNGYGPKKGSIDKNGTRLGSLFNGLKCGIYGKELQKEFKKIISFKTFKAGGTIKQRLSLLRQYIKKYGHGPKDDYIDDNGIQFGSLFFSLKRGSYGKELQKEFKKYITYRAYHNGGTVGQKVKLLRDYIKKNGYLPAYSYVDKNGVVLGIFLTNIKAGRCGKELQKEFKKYITNRVYFSRGSIDQKLLLSRNYVKKNGYLPTQIYITENGYKLGAFLGRLRYGCYGKELQKEFKKYRTYQEYKRKLK